MAQEYNILAIDPGATNVAGVLRRHVPGGPIGPAIVERFTESSEREIGPVGLRCETAPEVMFRLIERLPADERARLGAIAITSHGASQIPLDRAGEPVFGAISYDNAAFDSTHNEFLDRFGGAEALYLETGSAEYGKGINALQQLYYLMQEYPDRFARATDILPLSSYMAFWLTGERFTCHTHTRNHAYLETILPDNGWAWSRPVRELGLVEKFPPFKRPFEPYGTLRPELARDWGVPADCLVVAAGHDTSIASLLAPNTINTGTWICNTAATVSVDRVPQMASRSLVVNADVHGRHLRTLMARLGQTRDAYRAQFPGDLPDDLPFKGLAALSDTIIPLAFMEGVGVYRSLMEAELPASLRNDPETFIHALSFTIAIGEALSSILTSDPDLPLDRTLGTLLETHYRANDVVIGGNFVNDLPGGATGTFTGFFAQLYPGRVERFNFPEPTSYAAHILAVCAREGLDPERLGDRLQAPKNEITFHGDRKEISQAVRHWETEMKAFMDAGG